MEELEHGGDWAGFRQTYGGMPLDFSASISPLGLPEGARRAAERALAEEVRYPDPLCRDLRDRLGRLHRIPPEHILCGGGAADLIFRLMLARRPARALVTAPTFGEYERAMALTGCRVERYFLEEGRDFAVDRGLLERVEPDLDLVVLCEPNNPTGLATERGLLLEILARCARCGILLAVDECFNDFLDDPEGHSLTGQVEGHPNLLILRALTKSHAMAGLRLGYVLCADRALLEEMARWGQPWPVSAVAQAAGGAALEDGGYLPALRQLMAREREYLRRGLEGLGLRVVPGQANYLLFYTPREGLPERLRRRGILLRDCGGFPGLGPGWYRAAVRARADNDSLLRELREVL